MNAASRNHKFLAIVMVLVLALMASCSSDDDEPGITGPPDGEQAPPLPPTSSFVMDFADFSDTKQMSEIAAATSLVHFRAAVQVTVWQVILLTTLAVPTAALGESFNHTPTWADGVWTWSYDFNSGSDSYHARLEGEVIDGDAHWHMYISQDGGFPEVLWFSGQSGIASRWGTWTVNYDPDQVIPFVRIDYERDGQDPTQGEITYTSIEEGVALNGSHITHATIASGENYDRSYTIFIAEDDNTVEIEWNRLLQNGRTRDPDYYGDGDWRCWDEALEDVSCDDAEPVTIGTIVGTVTDATTEEPLAGALVRLDYSPGPAETSLSGSDGTYELSFIPEMPEYFALSASRDGYIPQSINLSRADVEDTTLTVDFELEPINDALVVVELVPDVHHLGDDYYSGAINSQFQKRSEGIEYSATFSMSSMQLPPGYNGAELAMLVKGAQLANPITINGTVLETYLQESPGDGSFGEFAVAIGMELLREGSNTLTIEAAQGVNYDDFEFVNVQLRLQP